jgi:hypothetical protein
MKSALEKLNVTSILLKIILSCLQLNSSALRSLARMLCSRR